MTDKARFYNKTIQSCARRDLATKLATATYRQSDAREAICLELGDVDRFRALSADLRDHVLTHLDTYLSTLTTNLERAGVQVHWADDAQAAQQIICRVARDNHVERIVKSKSMLTEEIGLNAALEHAGMEVTETDLGEYIVQLARQRPGHIVNPAVHLSTEDVAKIFAKRIGYDGPADPAALTAKARTTLRETFRAADMGISGVNFAVADPGLLCVCTNEGNGRHVTGRCRIHLAVMGIERLVPDLPAAALILKMLARFSTGQRITQYTNLIAGPRDGDGPEQVHLVLVDNGRSRILGTKYWQMLRCLRCGSCLNSCPVFKQIGGHPFPGCYGGPMGSVLLPLMLGPQETSDIPKASSLCNLCSQVCPVQIPLPEMILSLRNEQTGTGCRGFIEKMTMIVWAAVLRCPRMYRCGQKAMRWAIRPISKRGWVRWLPGPPGRWTSVKDLPLPAKRSFLAQVRSGEIPVNREDNT